MTWEEWIIKSIKYLDNCSLENKKKHVELLLTYVTKSKYNDIFIYGDNKLTISQYLILNNLLNRLKNGEPIYYLIKECEFWSLNLKVSYGTFIPRIETECLVDCALKIFPNIEIDVLDLGTGSGAIALALSYERSNWKITGVDCLLGSILLAKNNAKRLKLKNIKFHLSNWFKSIKNKKYDLIVSNPPYISYNDTHLNNINLSFEPRVSLISKENGLQDLFFICKTSKFFLKKNGWLILEHGWNQREKIYNILKQLKFKNISSILDFNGHDRVILAQFIQ